jgi:hypothetical protein
MKNVQRIVSIFTGIDLQCILVIDGKYSCGCGDGLSTTAMNSSAAIIGRRRVSDRWIPFKFPERTRAVRSE